MFLLYHSEGCNICEFVLRECYVNDLYTTIYSGVLGHRHASQLAPPPCPLQLAPPPCPLQLSPPPTGADFPHPAPVSPGAPRGSKPSLWPSPPRRMPPRATASVHESHRGGRVMQGTQGIIASYPPGDAQQSPLF
jgi:hypothetical protein